MAIATRGSAAISAPPWLRPRSTRRRQAPWPPRGMPAEVSTSDFPGRGMSCTDSGGLRNASVNHDLSSVPQPSPPVFRRLRLAGRAVRRTADADVEMVVVPPPRPDLFEPRAVGAGLAAQRHLDRRVDEDALHLGVRGGRLDHVEMAGRPQFRVDVAPAVGDHHGRRDLLALGAAKAPAAASTTARCRHRGRPGGSHGRPSSGRRAAATCHRPGGRATSRSSRPWR